uniref:Glycosyltransferase family 25 n=1 Tax=Pithovirus LCDPAC01 TaxID=2506600 RepID=A0A481YN17_9VIRU|nr:MAG: hypothetical protein LCDPAC01_01560 [Pithovirus LCDPAC01]
MKDVIFPKFIKHTLGGRYGCRDSHSKIWKDPEIKADDIVVIFEDDLIYTGKTRQYFWDMLEEASKLLRSNVCEIINLSGFAISRFMKISEHYWRGMNTTTCCYISIGRVLKTLPLRFKWTDCHIDASFCLMTNMLIPLNPLFTQDVFDTDNQWVNNKTVDQLSRYFLDKSLKMTGSRHYLLKLFSKINVSRAHFSKPGKKTMFTG